MFSASCPLLRNMKRKVWWINAGGLSINRQKRLFVTIEKSFLEAVVIRDTLTIEEIELFKAVDLWATKACERQGLSADGASKRRMLEEHLIKAIRFPTMKLEEFASVMLDSNILTKE